MDPFSFIAGLLTGLGAIVLIYVVFLIFRPWIRVHLCGGRISLLGVLGMRLRGSPVSLILDAYIALIQSGEKVVIRQVEACYLANRARITSAGDLEHFIRQSIAQ